MNVSKVYYQRNFRIGDFQYETIGIGIDVNVGEDAHAAMEEAKRLVLEYNAEQNHPTPHIVERTIPDELLPVMQVKDYIIATDFKVVIDEINKCETIQQLDEWNVISKGNHEARMVFASKAAQLLSPQK